MKILRLIYGKGDFGEKCSLLLTAFILFYGMAIFLATIEDYSLKKLVSHILVSTVCIRLYLSKREIWHEEQYLAMPSFPNELGIIFCFLGVEVVSVTFFWLTIDLLMAIYL